MSNNDNELMTLPAAQLPRLSFTETALQLKEGALETAALIAKVSTDEQERAAVQAQMELDVLQRRVEQSRKLVKAPVIDLGREIDNAAKVFCADIDAELVRISKLISDYASLKLAKQRAAEKAAREEQERIERERQRIEEEERQRIERERQEALATAKDHAELDAINERAAEEQRLAQERAAEEAAQAQAVAVAQIPTVTRQTGQVIRQEWEFEITNIGELARNHPGCVELKPRRSEIKSLLAQGIKVAGVRAWVETKAGVRIGRTSKAIEA